ncbi:hypothetical protein [Chryseobacterium sp.]|uniref:hypothetical protein n=1 Tax=Chryseobacterium sp. TaxID=1871047 RepID=UPI00321A1466
MSTKYKKVAVSDRLPNRSGDFLTSIGWLYFNPDTKEWGFHFPFSTPEYWLEEVPDYEDEMREMFEKAIQYLNQCDWCPNMVETYGNFVMNSTELLTKLKQQ